MKEVLEKLDKLDDRLDSVDKTLVRQEAQLAEHIRRTELLEHAHARLEQEIYEDLTPIKVHVGRVSLIGRIVLWGIPIGFSLFWGVLKYVNI